MTVDIVMPNLGFDTGAGRLIEWLKQPGESVQRGESIAVIESDKANVELESIASGIMLEQLYPNGAEVPIGAIIARIGLPTEANPTPPPSSDPAERPSRISPLAQRMAQAHQLDTQFIKGSGVGGRVTRKDIESHLRNGQLMGGTAPRALPKVRKHARELNIALEAVLAHSGHNPIKLADIERYRQREAPTPPATEISDRTETPLSRSRQIIGQRLADSARQAPHFYVSGEFDLEEALQHLKTTPTPQPRINDLLHYLVVRTLLRVPQLNATYEDGRLYHHHGVHLSFAVARAEGLITPVVRDAQNYSLQGLAQITRERIGRARQNRLQQGDLSGGTFTISNLGMIAAVERFTAVINPPQVAILAVGSVKQRPIVRDGGLHIRHTVYLTLSGDHRVVDGMDLAQFMNIFQEELRLFSG